MTIEKNKIKCDHRRCGWAGTEDMLLRAPSPFDADEELLGCPRCKSVDSCVMVCDESGCKEEATCGWPSKDGYRTTCYKHSSFSLNGGNDGTERSSAN